MRPCLLLPLAQQTNAVVLASAFPHMCALSRALTRMTRKHKARWA